MTPLNVESHGPQELMLLMSDDQSSLRQAHVHHFPGALSTGRNIATPYRKIQDSRDARGQNVDSLHTV